MHITLDIQNEKIAEHVLWVLEHFKKDGVVITKKSGQKVSGRKALSDDYVEENWKELAYKASGNPHQDDDEVLNEKYGKYLYEKYSI